MRFFSYERRIFYLSCVLMMIALLTLGRTAIKAQAAAVKEQEEAAKKEKAGATKEDFLRFCNIIAEVYELVQQKYVDDVEPKKLFEASVQGMFTALDDHSQYLSADNYEQLNKETEGGFSGVGIHIGLRNDLLTVIAPIPGSPAARAGIQPWDRIIKIEGKETRNVTLQDAVNKLTGPAGTKVSVTIYRVSERRSFDVTMTRAQVKVNSIYSRMLDGEIGYARIAKFSTDTSGDLKTALLSFHKKGAKGLILDLRYNTGGLLKEAIDVSSLFLEKGQVIVSTKGKDKTQNQEFVCHREPVTRLPVIILVNNASASASEIVAAALKENDRAMLLGPKGQKTYGKWSVQTIEELRNSLNYDEKGNPRRSAVRLTTAKYYSPKGHTYHNVGLPFDEEVEVTAEQQARLLAEGHLLGDPNMIESRKTEIDHFPTKTEQGGGPVMHKAEETKPEDETTTPVLVPEDESTSPTLLEEDQTTTAGAKIGKKKEPFHDVLLEYSQRLLRDHIILSGRRAA